MIRKLAQSLAFATFALVLAAFPASAADTGLEPGFAGASAEYPATTPVYVVPFMAGDYYQDTVITIANLDQRECDTVVEWKIGHGTFTCPTRLRLAGGSPVGDALTHCFRRTTGLPVSCATWCDLPNPRLEGAAIIRTSAACRNKIAVDARHYTFAYDESGVVTGVTELKVVKLPGGNKGD